MKNISSIIMFLIIAFLSIACTKGTGVKTNSGGSDSLKMYMGGKPELYEMDADGEKYNGKKVYHIKSKENITGDFGTIMTEIKPGEYKTKRVRMSGFIKTENLNGWAGMWMRVDSYEMGRMLGFDNMSTRPIKGTTDWQKYEIVLDVPDSSAGIACGILVAGNGEVWLAEPEFETVGEDIASTTTLTEEYFKTYDASSGLPPELKDIPVGIEVGHNPQTVLAQFNKADTMYYWVYKTSVKPIKEELEITEFGSYTWYSGRWVFSTITGKPFDKKDFSEWYKCKNGKLKKGKEYTDKGNWNRWATLQKGKSLWYYLGKNKKGEVFKGTAIVEFLTEEKK